ncbi:hypothetical protein ANANG_G00004360 [Anguilla anguilla]|uniref:YTH domain-containing family protein n=1 Tax=Anguilla anguilla TaxID=7936 RepID=A0A9D3MW07_ANGAN|nr:hypothetical protein ANANG_G00004360 [Anguilla anguilla]
MPYLASYGQLSNGEHHFLPDAMFGQAGALGSNPFLGQHGFNFFPGGIDFSAWGSSGSQGQSSQGSGFGSSYAYAPSSLGGAMIDGQSPFAANEPLNKAPGMNSLDQSMAALKIGGAGDMAPKQRAAAQPGLPSPAPPPAGSAAPLTNGQLAPAGQLGPHHQQPSPGQPQLPPQGPPRPSPLPPAGSRPVTVPTAGGTAGGGGAGSGGGRQSPPSSGGVGGVLVPSEPHPVLEKLRLVNNYNPKDFDWNPKQGRVFIIKSYSEDDIHRSIKYNVWCSTEHGNKRLDAAYRSLAAKGPLYLLFSVNGSGHFCGVAEMRSPVDYNTCAGVWSQDKWKGRFDVRWIFVKDVPNSQLRHIRLENNENKPVTNSRDTQEVPLDKARQVLKIIAAYKHTTSIFDDFSHYEKRQEEEESVKKVEVQGSDAFSGNPGRSHYRLQDRQGRVK